MKIIVSIKQVPDTSGKVAVNPDGTLNRASMQTITNPDDMNALEAALKIKDATGCKVVVVTMGPPPAAGMLREALAMGADEAVLVSAREFGGSDTYATSQILAAAINKIGVEADDIVMCVAISMATLPRWVPRLPGASAPGLTYAADIQKDGDTITVKRMLEDGYMTIKVKTPCLITCIKELNEPRYMSVGGVFRAYSKPMTTYSWALKDDPDPALPTIGLKSPPTSSRASARRGAGAMEAPTRRPARSQPTFWRHII